MSYTLHLSSTHADEIKAHGERTYPNECCGFLLGKMEDGKQIIHQIMPAVNEHGEEAQFNRFTITAKASFLAEKAARKAKLDIIGHYHSHPNAKAIPSQGFPESDLENATWPGYAFTIVSVMEGKAEEIRSWLLVEDRSRFDEQAVEYAS